MAGVSNPGLCRAGGVQTYAFCHRQCDARGAAKAHFRVYNPQKLYISTHKRLQQKRPDSALFAASSSSCSLEVIVVLGLCPSAFPTTIGCALSLALSHLLLYSLACSSLQRNSCEPWLCVTKPFLSRGRPVGDCPSSLPVDLLVSVPFAALHSVVLVGHWLSAGARSFPGKA